ARRLRAAPPGGPGLEAAAAAAAVPRSEERAEGTAVPAGREEDRGRCRRGGEREPGPERALGHRTKVLILPRFECTILAHVRSAPTGSVAAVPVARTASRRPVDRTWSREVSRNSLPSHDRTPPRAPPGPVRRAVLPAAGRGTRMRTVAGARAKELLPVGGRPLIAHGLLDLAAAGVTEALVVVSPDKPELARELGPRVGGVALT